MIRRSLCAGLFIYIDCAEWTWFHFSYPSPPSSVAFCRQTVRLSSPEPKGDYHYALLQAVIKMKNTETKAEAANGNAGFIRLSF